jgi:predicted nucleic acid-binding protein
MPDYMLDTNIFSNLVNGCLPLAQLPSDGRFWATHVQLEELSETKDVERRAELIAKFYELTPETRNAAFALDVKGAGCDQAELRENPSVWLSLKNALDAKNNGHKNNGEDTCIAEAAHFHGCVLITGDSDLAAVAESEGIAILKVTFLPRAH